MSDREKLEYFISDLDMHLSFGKSALEALIATVEDYTFIYHSKDDDRTVLGLAAEIALKHLRDSEGESQSGLRR